MLWGKEQKSVALNLISNARETMRVVAVIAMIPVAVASVLIVAIRNAKTGARSVSNWLAGGFDFLTRLASARKVCSCKGEVDKFIAIFNNETI